MSKTAKILIAAVILFALGVVVGGAGFLFGGVDALKQEFDRSTVDHSEVYTDRVSKLELSTVEDDVIILPSEDGKCHVSYTDDNNHCYELSLTDGTLRLTCEDTMKPRFAEFSLENHPVQILLPAAYCARLQLTTVSGSVQVSGIDFDETAITTVSGGIALTDGDFGEASITTTSGSTVLENYDAAVTDIKTVSGSVTGTVATPKRYSIHSVSGTLEAPSAEDAAGTFTAETVSGNVKITAP